MKYLKSTSVYPNSTPFTEIKVLWIEGSQHFKVNDRIILHKRNGISKHYIISEITGNKLDINGRTVMGRIYKCNLTMIPQ